MRNMLLSLQERPQFSVEHPLRRPLSTLTRCQLKDCKRCNLNSAMDLLGLLAPVQPT